MAKATDTMTLTAVRDISSVTWFYQIKTGTSAPATPTASPPPSPWQTTEPSYTAGDTKYLFVTERTIYTDGTFEYTTPSLSSSYEAAKQAYNEAQNAKKTATDYIVDVSNGVYVHASGTPDDPTNGSAKGVRILSDIDIIRGGISVANFGDSVRVGKSTSGNAYAYIDYHSLQLIDRNAGKYFEVCDLRDTGGSYTVRDSFTGDGTSIIFPLSATASSTSYSVTVDGTSVSTGITKSVIDIEFDVAPANGARIVVTYASTSNLLKALTFGIRAIGSSMGLMSTAEGYLVESSGAFSHAEGNNTQATSMAAHAEGSFSKATGQFSHAEGSMTTASGLDAHAEGLSTLASGLDAHAEGAGSSASGDYSHAEGKNTTASAYASHAEGFNTEATGDYSHAEGNEAAASGDWAHAEGRYTTASGNYSHAEGYSTVASGKQSHARGRFTKAQGENQTVLGKYNIGDTDHAVIIGNGTASSSSGRCNALTIDWNGGVELYLDVTLDTNSSSSTYQQASSGSDKDLYNAIYALGWVSDCIES